MNQKGKANADAVIVINTEDDELFVMSGGGQQESDNKNNFESYPVTVLVAGADGQAILNTVDSFGGESKNAQLLARVSVVRDQTEVSQSMGGFSVAGNQFWPGVRATSEGLQIFSPSGWGVHAVQRQSTSNVNEMEWQLFVMSHEVKQQG